MTSILENCPGVLLLNTLNGGQCKENQTKTMNQGEKKLKCEQNWYIHMSGIDDQCFSKSIAIRL